MESSAVTYGACADSFVLVFNSLLAAASFVSTIMLGCTVVLIVLARRAFHQIFGVIFTLLLLGYVVCNTISLASFCLTFFHAYPDIITYLDVAYDGSYTYTGCLAACCVLERTFATVYMETYESRRPWCAFLASQILSASVVSAQSFLLVIGIGTTAKDFILLSLSCCVCTLLIALYFINKHLLLAYRGGRRSLSTRYQLAENVRAVRLVVPVIILDTMVTLVDLISSRFFDVGMMFDAVKCSNKNYVTTFLICRLLSLVAELLIPIVVVRHESVGYVVRACCKGRRVDDGNERRKERVQNVLGMDVQGQSGDYLDQLRRQWS